MSSRVSYTTSFKLKVVMFAKENGNRAAGREFKVDERCIRRWRGQEGVLKTTPNKKRSLRHGLAKFPEHEVELIGWIKAKRQLGVAVSTTLIRLKAKCWEKDQGIKLWHQWIPTCPSIGAKGL